MIQPLAGVRIVDFSHGLAGPLCGYQLGLYGAEVIKIERPGTGDNFRDRGTVFDAVNAGKRSMTLDLSDPDATDELRELLLSADIVVHNFRPSVAKRHGLDPTSVLGLKPELVVCTISGFGLRGPWEDRPAIESTAQAASGLMSTYVDMDDRSGLGVLMLDPFTGILAVQSILAAWMERQHTGKGQHVDVSLLDSALIAQSVRVPAARAGKRGPASVERPGVGRFRVADGVVFIAAISGLWQRRTFEVLGLKPELADSLRDSDNAVDAMRQIIEIAGEEWSAAHLADSLTTAGVPAGVVETLADVLADDHPLRPHVSLETGVDRAGNSIPLIGSAVRFNGASLAPRSPVPALGEFNATCERGADGTATERIH